MARVDNSVVIHAPMDLVWDMTNDIESWPELFTEYAAAEIIERDGPTVRFRLTLHPDENGKSWSWVSERTPDPVTRTVRARRIETGPFEYMNLFWEYQETGDGVRMRWVQDFTVRPGLPFDDEAMAQRLNANTRREMGVIKEKIERVAGHRSAGPAGEPVQVLLRMQIKPGEEAAFEKLWLEHAQIAAAAPGNLGQSLSRAEDSGEYVILASWADEPAFRTFERSSGQQEYLRRLWPLRTRGSMSVLRATGMRAEG